LTKIPAADTPTNSAFISDEKILHVMVRDESSCQLEAGARMAAGPP